MSYGSGHRDDVGVTQGEYGDIGTLTNGLWRPLLQKRTLGLSFDAGRVLLLGKPKPQC